MGFFLGLSKGFLDDEAAWVKNDSKIKSSKIGRRIKIATPFA
jgi:hypothetical protein